MSTRVIKSAALVSSLLFLIASSEARADTTHYGAAIRAANKDIKAGHKLKALKSLKRLHWIYPHNPEVSALLLQTQCSLHRFKDAGRLIQSVKRDAAYPELRHAIRSCHEERIFTHALSLLQHGDAKRAIGLVSPLFSRSSDPYRAGLILARAYEADDQLPKAIATYKALAKRYPEDKELIVQVRRLEVTTTLAKARQELAAGNSAKAILLVRPLYESGLDPYDAGLILARAYTAERNVSAAASVYAALAKKYPRDKDLAVASVVNNVEAGRRALAQADLRQLDGDQRRAVFSSLGQGVNRLFGNFVTISGTVAASTYPYPSDQAFGLQEGTATAIGTFVAGAQQTHRFAQTADMYSLDYYTSLGSGYSGEASVDYSPNNTILAHDAFGLALSRRFADFSLDGSIRHLIYSRTVANVLFGGVGLHPTANIRVETGIYYVPEVRAYSVLVAPEWFHNEGNRTYLYVTGGQTGEQLIGSSSIVRTPSYSVTLGETFQITHRTYLNTEVFYEHRASLYNRRGAYIALTRRW